MQIRDHIPIMSTKINTKNFYFCDFVELAVKADLNFAGSVDIFFRRSHTKIGNAPRGMAITACSICKPVDVSGGRSQKPWLV